MTFNYYYSHSKCVFVGRNEHNQNKTSLSTTKLCVGNQGEGTFRTKSKINLSFGEDFINRSHRNTDKNI